MSLNSAETPPPGRKNKQTEKIERTKVLFPLWRKKVDNSIFREAGTTIPNWVCARWTFSDMFPGIVNSKSAETAVTVLFEKGLYKGYVASSHPNTRPNPIYRFYFDEKLLARLKQAFPMSYMRYLESRLRSDTTDIETEIPFWEFLDIEFDISKKRFLLDAHYRQVPTFPELFKNLIGSPAIKRIEDGITHPEHFRIQKQDWRSRQMFESELGAVNVIYMLIDTRNKLIYVGEAADLIKRFKAGHSRIKEWDFYRYDQLPPMPRQNRVAFERMLIRVFASLLENKAGVSTKSISNYCLANRRVDN